MKTKNYHKHSLSAIACTGRSDRGPRHQQVAQVAQQQSRGEALSGGGGEALTTQVVRSAPRHLEQVAQGRTASPSAGL